jgi:hypothetical protein
MQVLAPFERSIPNAQKTRGIYHDRPRCSTLMEFRTGSCRYSQRVRGLCAGTRYFNHGNSLISFADEYFYHTRFQELTQRRNETVQLKAQLATEGIVVSGAVRPAAQISVGTREQLSTLYRLYLPSISPRRSFSMTNSFRATTTGWTGFARCLPKKHAASRSSFSRADPVTTYNRTRWCLRGAPFMRTRIAGSYEPLIWGVHFGGHRTIALPDCPSEDAGPRRITRSLGPPHWTQASRIARHLPGHSRSLPVRGRTQQTPNSRAHHRGR